MALACLSMANSQILAQRIGPGSLVRYRLVLPSVSMKHLLILAVHLLATIGKLVRPGGVRAVVAESLLLKHQLLISRRARRRAPNLNSFDRFLLGFGSLFVPPSSGSASQVGEPTI